MTEVSPQPEKMADGAFDPDEVRAALLRLKDREPFKSAPQLTAFLNYVVEETLAGRSHEIKGYSIATLALGRPESFDPQTDPIVRVQAGRLRHALAEYDSAHDDAVIISLPKGTYVPSFARRTVSQSDSTPQPRLQSPLSPHSGVIARKRLAAHARARRLTAALVGFLSISATLIGLYAFGYLRKEPIPVAYVPPSIFPEIVIDEINSGFGGQEAASVAERLRDAIARFDDIVVVREQIDYANGQLLPPPPALGAQLRLRLFVADAQPGFRRYSARLVEQQDQSIVWSREFDPIASGQAGEEHRSNLIRYIASSIAQPYGVVHGYTRRILPTKVYADTPYHCLLASFEYQLLRSKTKQQETLTCIEENLKRFPGVAALHSQRAYLLIEAYRFGFVSADRRILDEALKSARLGVRLAPASARAHQSLFTTLFVRKELPAAWRAANRALELNPFDTETQAEYGSRLILSGQIEKGIDVIDRAYVLNPAPPPAVMTIKAFGLHMAGRLDEALKLSEALKWSEFPLAMMGRIVLAQARNDRDDGALGLRIMQEQFPSVIADVHGYLERSNLEPTLAARAAALFNSAVGWASSLARS
jgi:tetratricopeptide (TPR) repeat protein